MNAPETARRWQDRFDHFFPHGVIIASADNPQGYTYPVPRPEVVRMRGFDPVVFLDVPSWDRNMSGILTGWEPLKETPCRVVRVTLDLGPGQHDSKHLWSGNISPAQARALSPDRKRSLLLSQRGELFHGEIG
jgi:hypothetical protein